MAYILKTTAEFQAHELISLLRERPDLLHPRIRFLQGPFPIQNMGHLDLLGLDDQGGWVLVKIAQEGNAELLLEGLHQVSWVQSHSSWITTLPSYDVADPASVPTVFLVAPHFSNSLSDVLGYLQNVTVGLVKYSGFDMGDQKAIHFEPLFQPPTGVPEGPGKAPEQELVQEGQPNLALLQPLTDEEIAEFLPGSGKEGTA